MAGAFMLTKRERGATLFLLREKRRDKTWEWDI